jgi:hypothetical protein
MPQVWSAMLKLHLGLHLKQPQVQVNRQLAPPPESTFSRHPTVGHTNSGLRH